jgi:D-glycerate 3-kinase
LSKEIHPLLATRGVPGTHDLGLAFDTLDKLTNAQGTVQIPRFDKASDNRKEKGEWSQIETPVDIIILEGWCVGIPAQSEIDLERAINSLEQDYDEDGKWRKYVNDQLLGAYASLWQQIDQLIMLKAPDFSCVFEWRLEQEEKLKRSTESTLLSENKIMAPEEIKHFIQHYERLTRHALEHLPEHCHHVFELDSKRVIQSYLNADTGDCI